MFKLTTKSGKLAVEVEKARPAGKGLGEKVSVLNP